MICKTCKHYGLWKMITGKDAYGYTGDIPCLKCKYYATLQDNYIPAGRDCCLRFKAKQKELEGQNELTPFEIMIRNAKICPVCESSI